MKPLCSITPDAGSKHLKEIHVPSLSLEPMRGLLDRDETVQLGSKRAGVKGDRMSLS